MGDKCGDGDCEGGRRREEAFIDAARNFRSGGISAVCGDLLESAEEPERGAEEADEWRGVGNGAEEGQVAFEPGHLELAGLLSDFA